MCAVQGEWRQTSNSIELLDPLNGARFISVPDTSYEEIAVRALKTLCLHYSSYWFTCWKWVGMYHISAASPFVLNVFECIRLFNIAVLFESIVVTMSGNKFLIVVDMPFCHGSHLYKACGHAQSPVCTTHSRILKGVLCSVERTSWMMYDYWFRDRNLYLACFLKGLALLETGLMQPFYRYQSTWTLVEYPVHTTWGLLPSSSAHSH